MWNRTHYPKNNNSWTGTNIFQAGVEVIGNIVNIALTAILGGKMPYHGTFLRSQTSMSFNNTSKVFTLTRLSGADFYIGGTLYTLSGNLTCDFTLQPTWSGTPANNYGQWYVWMYISGGNPTLAASKTAWNITDLTAIPISTVYWDGTTGVVTEERHGYLRNIEWHEWAHDNIGTVYQSGFSSSPTFVDNTFSFAGGVIADEDIHHNIVDWFSGSAVTPITHCQIMYRASTLSSMITDSIGTAWYKKVTNPQYDLNGTLTDIGNGSFGNAFIYATNRIGSTTVAPIVAVVGQGDYTTAALAQAAPQPTFAGFSSLEWRLLYRVTYKRNGTGINTITVNNLYNTSLGTVISSPSASSVTAVNVIFAPYGNISSTNVQAAIDELDTEKQNVINSINSQTGTTYTLVLTDSGKFITCDNASPITLTVPPNSDVAFSIGTQIDIIQKGAGKLTVAQGSGVTISSKGSNKSLAAQFVGATLLKIDTNVWYLFGDLIA